MNDNLIQNQQNANDAGREQRNEEAWRNLHGYETPGGCPCYDPTVDDCCIPKRTGYGLNINLATTGGKIFCFVVIAITIASIIVCIVLAANG